jgi:hypothetical protein
MSRIKLTVLSFAAAVLLSAVGASAASALEYEVNDAAAVGNALTATGGKAILESKIVGERIIITCEESVGTGTLEAAGKSSLKAEFKNACKVKRILGATDTLEALAKCTVEEPIKTEATGALNNSWKVTFTGVGAEEVFATIKITGAECAEKGTFKAKLKQVCSSPEGEVEANSHEIWCTPVESTLKLGIEEARFWGVFNAKVVAGSTWSSKAP